MKNQNTLLKQDFDEFKKIVINNYNSISNFKKILFVLHSGSGGSPKTINDLVKYISNKYECYLLTSNSNELILYKFQDNKFDKIEYFKIKSNWLVETPFIEEFYNIYLKLFIKYHFDIVNIHNLIFHTFDIIKLSNQLDIPIIVSLHDLYLICPAYTLLDGDYKFCHGNCHDSNSKNDCFMPMKGMTNINNMKEFLPKWRKWINQLFLNVNNVIAPSNFIKDIFFDHYNISPDKIRIIEHGDNYFKINEELFEVPNINKPTKILFLGNLYLQKGYPLIKELYELDKCNKLEFHFLGFTPEELNNLGIHHGRYNLCDLPDYIKNIKPSFIGIFSLCGESYCYTLSEAWNFNIPVLVTKLGALEERVSKNGGGWFIDLNDMNKTYSYILSIIEDSDEYLAKQSEIKNIKFNSIEDMAKEYCIIYEEV